MGLLYLILFVTFLLGSVCTQSTDHPQSATQLMNVTHNNIPLYDNEDPSEHSNCTEEIDNIGEDTICDGQEEFIDEATQNTTSSKDICVDNDGGKKAGAEVKDCNTTKSRRVSIIDTGTLSKHQFEVGEIVCRYITYPLFASAIIINVINIIVYSDASMRSPTSTYLIALSLNELLFATLSLFRPILKNIYGVQAVKQQIYLTFAMYVSVFLLSALRRLMYCFTTLVSTERFLAVAFPLKARSFRLIKSPMIFIFAIFTFCLLCHLPRTFKFDVVQKSNSTDYTIKHTRFYLNNKAFINGMSMANKIFYAYLILLLGLLVNVFVLVALKKHTKNRQKMDTSVDAEKAAKRERQTTITILTSTFLFTFLSLPLATDSIVSTYLSDYGLYRKEHYIYLLMKDVNTLLIMCSLSTDFIVYMLLSRAYRRTFFMRIPFMAAIFRRRKYLKDSVRELETKMYTISRTDTKET